METEKKNEKQHSSFPETVMMLGENTSAQNSNVSPPELKLLHFH